MQHQYTLTYDEKTGFHHDEIRGEIRGRVSSEFPTEDTIQIVDSDGELWDTVNGSIDRPLTPEEIQDRLEKQEHDEWVALEENARKAAALKAEDDAAAEALKLTEDEQKQAARFEEVIKPTVLKKLRSEARKEFKDQIRDQTNEILNLRQTVASQQNDFASKHNKLMTEHSFTKAELSRLKAKMPKESKEETPVTPSGETTAPTGSVAQ